MSKYIQAWGSNLIWNQSSDQWNIMEGKKCKIKSQDKFYLAINYQRIKRWNDVINLSSHLQTMRKSWMRLKHSTVIKSKSFLKWHCQSLEMLLWHAMDDCEPLVWPVKTEITCKVTIQNQCPKSDCSQVPGRKQHKNSVPKKFTSFW